MLLLLEHVVGNSDEFFEDPLDSVECKGIYGHDHDHLVE